MACTEAPMLAQVPRPPILAHARPSTCKHITPDLDTQRSSACVSMDGRAPQNWWSTSLERSVVSFTRLWAAGLASLFLAWPSSALSELFSSFLPSTLTVARSSAAASSASIVFSMSPNWLPLAIPIILAASSIRFRKSSLSVYILKGTDGFFRLEAHVLSTNSDCLARARLRTRRSDRRGAKFSDGWWRLLRGIAVAQPGSHRWSFRGCHQYCHHDGQ